MNVSNSLLNYSNVFYRMKHWNILLKEFILYYWKKSISIKFYIITKFSISFKRLFNGNIIEEILNNNKQLESINFGNNGINYNVANIIYMVTLFRFKVR